MAAAASLRPPARSRPPPSRPGCSATGFGQCGSVQTAVKEGEVRVHIPRPRSPGTLHGGSPHTASQPPGPQGTAANTPGCGFPPPCPYGLKGSLTTLSSALCLGPDRCTGRGGCCPGSWAYGWHWTLTAEDQAMTSPEQRQRSRPDS